MSKGNGKHPGGRPTKYKPEYCQMIVDFFDYEVSKIEFSESKQTLVPQKPRFLSDFAHSVGVAKVTLNDWANKHEEFSIAFKKAKEKMINNIVVGGLTGVYNSGVACFTLKNIAGWRDRTEHKHEGLPETKIVLVTPKESRVANRVESLSV